MYPTYIPLKQMFKHSVEEHRVTWTFSDSHPSLVELIKKLFWGEDVKWLAMLLILH